MKNLILVALSGSTPKNIHRRIINFLSCFWALLLAGCIFGPNYDAPVRELSLKLDDLASYEAKEGVTIADMKRKLDIYSKEIDLAASKIEAGGEREQVVRAYYGAAIDYLDKKSKDISSLEAASAVLARAENFDISGCTRYAGVVGGGFGLGSCLMNAGQQAGRIEKELEAVQIQRAASAANLGGSITALAKARDNAFTVISSKSAVSMENFDKLLAPEKVDVQERKSQGGGLVAVNDTAADKSNDMAREELLAAGKRVYEFNCMACHRPDGLGIGPIKKLDGSPLLARPDLNSALQVVVFGAASGAMPSWKQLSNTEIAAVVTYAGNNWSNKSGVLVQPAQVSKVRNSLDRPKD